MLLLSWVGIFGSFSVLASILSLFFFGERCLKTTATLTLLIISWYVSGIDENWRLFQAFISAIAVFITWVCAYGANKNRLFFDIAAIASFVVITTRVILSVRL